MLQVNLILYLGQSNAGTSDFSTPDFPLCFFRICHIQLDHSNFKFGLSYCANEILDEKSNTANNVDQNGL